MFETSKDVLFVVLAICIVWLTFFLCWMMYYVIAIVRDIEKVVRLVKGVATRIDDMTSRINEKLDRSAASFGFLAKAAKELIVWAIEEKAAKPKAKRTSKK